MKFMLAATISWRISCRLEMRKMGDNIQKHLNTADFSVAALIMLMLASAGSS